MNAGNDQPRTFPQAVETEAAVLSSCLLGIQSEILELLQPAHFYRDAHRLIFEAIKALDRQGLPVDVLTVADCLRGAGDLEKIGGAVYLASLVDVVPLAVNIPHYCAIVKQASIRRQVIMAAQRIITMGYDQPDVESLLTEAHRAFVDIDSNTAGNHSVTCSELAAQAVERYESMQNGSGLAGLSTGYPVFDVITGGLQKSELYVIAARPGMGKSALALNIAANVAENGNPVFISSLEMSKEGLFDRIVSNEARIDSRQLRGAGMDQSEWHRVLEIMPRVERLPLEFDDDGALHYAEIIRRARQSIRKSGVKLVIVDYLGLIRGDNSRSKALEVGEITGAFKAFAKDARVPVVLLSQLNRGVESRNDKRPVLSDLRESGAIEQDADVVAFLYRDEYYNPETDQRGIAELKIAKHRNGATGTARLRWIDWRTRFEDVYQRPAIIHPGATHSRKV